MLGGKKCKIVSSEEFCPSSRRLQVHQKIHLACGTLITLWINLYNSRDHIDTPEACFFNSNTPFSLRGSGCFDATGAGDDLGNGSGAVASRCGHRAVCVSARAWACFAQHQHIDLGQKAIDWCLPVSRRCHSGCHTLGRCSAHAAAAGWHGNFLEPTVS